MTCLLLDSKKTSHPEAIASVKSQSLVEGYSSTQLAFTFLPLHTGIFETRFTLIYDQVQDNDAGDDAVAKEQVITIRGVGKQSCIYMDISQVDFGCVYHNKIYRKPFEIKNRGSVSVRVDVRGDAAIRDLVEIAPAMMLVQAGGSLSCSIKLAPTASNLASLQTFLAAIDGYEAASTLLLPIRIDVSNFAVQSSRSTVSNAYAMLCLDHK
jgi:hypothetical protein